jgi:hypothetical protein
MIRNAVPDAAQVRPDMIHRVVAGAARAQYLAPQSLLSESRGA